MPNPHAPDTYSHYVYEQLEGLDLLQAKVVPLPEPLKRLYKHKPMTPERLIAMIHVIAGDTGSEFITKRCKDKMGVIVCRVG